MVCGNCIREIPDGSAVCPRCGSVQNSGDSASLAETPAQVSSLLADMHSTSRSTAPAAPAQRGWEQTGRFESAYQQEEGHERRAPSFSVFSAYGRLNRTKHWYFLLVELMASVVLCVGMLFSSLSVGLSGGLMIWLSTPLGIMMCVVSILVAIKRFHDIDEPGSHVFMLLIPFYNIYVGLKLLFKGSAQSNEYGGTVSNGWYWQLPLTILLLPVVYCCVSFGLSGSTGISSLLAASEENRYYSSVQHGVSITFPAGWTRTEMDDYVAAAQNWNGSELIALEVTPTEADSFDKYSDQDYEDFMSALQDKDTLARLLEINAENISELNCSKKEINGRTFVQVGFRQIVDSVGYRKIYVLGIYNGNVYAAQLAMPDISFGNALDIMLESADTLMILDKGKNDKTD